MDARYLILSDLHLCDVEDHPDGWKAYKSARHLFDRDLAALLARFAGGAAPGERLVLVLNGDIFDFDLVTAVPDDPPWPVSRAERLRGLEPSEAKSAWKLRRILDHHPELVAALGRFIGAGHEVVYVLGNHDRELHFVEVRGVLVAAVTRAGGGRDAARRLRFEPWFFYVPGELYVEHGNQYDHYSSFRPLLAPVVTVRGEEQIALPMGNVSNRFMLSRMGFFNPHANEDFILNLGRYLLHWVRHYACSRRSLAVTWLLTSLSVVVRLLATKARQALEPDSLRSHHRARAALARRQGLPPEKVAALERLHRPPVGNRLLRLLHELWIDRMLVTILVGAGAVALALSAAPVWLKVVAPITVFQAVFLVYGLLLRGDSWFVQEHEVPQVAREIAQLLDVKVVALGHTHVPQVVPLSRGVTFVNSGTWAPMMPGDAPERQPPGYRNYVDITVAEGEVTVRLDSWSPTPTTAPAPVAAPAPVPAPVRAPASAPLIQPASASLAPGS
jgi:UDP-2,3-diacylglucosamine pyrophosphatase LpxH